MSSPTCSTGHRRPWAEGLGPEMGGGERWGRETDTHLSLLYKRFSSRWNKFEGVGFQAELTSPLQKPREMKSPRVCGLLQDGGWKEQAKKAESGHAPPPLPHPSLFFILFPSCHHVLSLFPLKCPLSSLPCCSSPGRQPHPFRALTAATVLSASLQAPPSPPGHSVMAACSAFPAPEAPVAPYKARVKRKALSC